MKHQSNYDKSRPTVGKIYRDLHLKPTNDLIVVGDMTPEIIKGFIEDLNEAILSKPFGERPFYILVHEAKDLQMREAFKRRIFKQLWRPYPEDDTTVFWHDPKAFETRYCWSLPHWSEMYNMLNSKDLFHPDLITEIIDWRNHRLEKFGFQKDEEGNWQANPRFKDKSIDEFAKTRSCLST